MTTSPQLVFDTIASILSNSQTSIASHPKQIDQLRKLYNNTEFDLFFQKLLRCVQAALVSIQKNPNIDRCLEFVAKFAASLTIKTSTAATSASSSRTVVTDSTANNATITEDDEMSNLSESSDQFENPLFTRLLDFLMTATSVSCDAVRYRASQLIGKMMSVVSNDHFLDEDVYFKLSDTLLERLKDVNSRVQVTILTNVFSKDPNMIYINR